MAGPIQSTYWWKGQIEQATEWVVIAKTRGEFYQAVEDAIKARHPYETPDIIAVPIAAGLHSYLDWIKAETAQNEHICHLSDARTPQGVVL